MSNISEKLDRLATYKDDIKDAIITKGQQVDDNMSTYADAIQAIESGGGGDDLSRLIEGSLETLYDEGATNVRGYLFQRDTTLKYVNLPNVINVLQYAFDHSSLVELNLENAVSIGQYACYGIRSLQTINIPHAIELYSSAFQYCYPLERVYLPNVQVMANAVFFECTNLKLADFSDNNNRTTIPTLTSSQNFDYCHADLKIVVPDALYEDWKVAPRWSVYADKIVKYSDYYQNN